MKSIFFQITLFLTIFLFFTSFLTNFAESAEVDENIVLWLQFDKGKGDTVIDSSKYGNDGEIQGAKWVEGKYGSALLFDGTNFVKVESNDTLQLSEEGLTLAAWFKTESEGDDLAIIEKGAWDSGEYGLFYPGWTGNSPGGQSRFRFQIFQIQGKETPQIDSKSGTPELSDNEWHYGAGTYDAVNQVFRVYIDGELQEEQGAAPHVFTPDDQPVYIGCRNGQGNHFNGAIDEVLVANIPFTAAQLQAHMEGNLMPVYPKGKLTTVWGKIRKTSE